MFACFFKDAILDAIIMENVLKEFVNAHLAGMVSSVHCQVARIIATIMDNACKKKEQIFGNAFVLMDGKENIANTNWKKIALIN